MLIIGLPLINILILNWNSSTLVVDMIGKFQQAVESDRQFRVIVVDNDLKSNADLYLKDDFNGCELYYIWNRDNLGYAEGNNRGISFIKDNGLTGNVVIVNPDVDVGYSDVLKMDSICKGNIGGVMCSAKTPSGKKLYSSLKLQGLTQSWIIKGSGVVSTDYLAGSLMVINASVLQDPNVMEGKNLFDPRYFLYWEEVDLSKRLLNAGYLLKSDSDVEVVRSPNSSDRVGKSFYYLNRNIFLLKSKFSDVGYKDVYLYLILSLLSSFKKFFLDFDSNALMKLTSAVADGLRFKFGRKW